MKTNGVRTPSDKRKTITFEPLDDVRELLEQAAAATGMDRSALINESVRLNLVGVVQKLVLQRERATEKFFRDNGRAVKLTKRIKNSS